MRFNVYERFQSYVVTIYQLLYLFSILKTFRNWPFCLHSVEYRRSFLPSPTTILMTLWILYNRCNGLGASDNKSWNNIDLTFFIHLIHLKTIESIFEWGIEIILVSVLRIQIFPCTSHIAGKNFQSSKIFIKTKKPILSVV